MIKRMLKILTVMCLTLGTLLNGTTIRAEETEIISLAGKWFLANDKDSNSIKQATGEISIDEIDETETGQWMFSNAIPTAEGNATVFISKPEGNESKPIGFKVKEGTGADEDHPYNFELVYPEAEVTSFTVTLTGGANSTPSGEMTQSELTGAMEAVTFTANEGYHYEAYEGETINGVTAVLKEGVITVSGTPTDNVEIVIPNAVQDAAKPESEANPDDVNKVNDDTTIETNSLKKMTLKTANVDEGETQYNLWVGGTQVTSANAEDTEGNRGWSYTPATTGENPTPAKLTLNNANITKGYPDTLEESGIYYNGADALEIVLAEGSDNIIAKSEGDFKYCGIYSADTNAAVTISGTGKLTAKGSDNGIKAKNNLTINGGNVSAIGVGSGINAANDVTIKGGIVNATATYDGGSHGIIGRKNVTIEGGDVTAYATGSESDGIKAYEGIVNISGGNVIASGKTQAIVGNVKNFIAGIGWTNKEGTEGKTDIEISDTARSLNYKKVQFPPAPVASITIGSATTEYTSFDSALAAWEDGSTLKLLADVEIASEIAINTKTVTLDLNGYGIRMTGNNGVFYIGNGATLNLYDNDNSSRTHFVTLNSWRGTAVSDTGPAQAVTDGSGVAQVTGGYITGGNVPNNYYGGGAFRVDGTLNMYGGTLLGNLAEKSGGAIWSVGTTTIAGDSRIMYNKGAENNRGGVYISSGKFNISGAPDLTGNSGCDVVLNGTTNISFINFDKNVRLGKLYITTDPVRVFTKGANFKSDEEVQAAIQHFYPDSRVILRTEKGQAKVSCKHNFTYAAGTGDNANTITATCIITNCDLPDHKATLTIAKPLHTAYGDDKDPSAVITDENKIIGDATVKYYKTNDTKTDKTGEELGKAPTEPGTYWAEITLGTGNNTATAHVIYTISDAYYVYQGDNQTWQKGSSDSLKLTFKGKYNDREGSSKSSSETYENWLKTVTVDGKTIGKSSYNATEGSLIIDLKPAYLETLSVGDHKLSVSFEKAENVVTANFTVKAKSSGGGSSTPEKKTDNVVTCQMAGFPANYAWNEAAKACQPGYLDAGGNFHPYGTARRSNVPNTSDNGNLTMYTIAMFLMTFVAYITAKKLTEDSRA